MFFKLLSVEEGNHKSQHINKPPFHKPGAQLRKVRKAEELWLKHGTL